MAVLATAALVALAGCKGGSGTATVDGHKYHVSVSPDGQGGTSGHTSSSSSPAGKGGGKSGGGQGGSSSGHGQGGGGHSSGGHSSGGGNPGGGGSHGGSGGHTSGGSTLGFGNCLTPQGIAHHGSYVNANASFSCATIQAFGALSGNGTVTHPEKITVAGATYDVWGGRAELAAWNADRAHAGLRPVAWNAQWAADAVGCAIYLAVRNHLANCDNSDTFWDGGTEGNPAAVVNLFWNSPPHRYLMLQHGFTMGGAGIVQRVGDKATWSAITGGPGFNY